MSETVDRVADAIIATMFAEHEIPVPADLRAKYLDTARAAIKAMRNPTDTMLDAATEGDWDPLSVWTKMIAEALR